MVWKKHGSFLYSPVSNLKYIFFISKTTLRSPWVTPQNIWRLPRASLGTPKYLKTGKETMSNSQNTWRLERKPWVTPKYLKAGKETMSNSQNTSRLERKPQVTFKPWISKTSEGLINSQNTWRLTRAPYPKYLETGARKPWETPKIPEGLQGHHEEPLKEWQDVVLPPLG